MLLTSHEIAGTITRSFRIPYVLYLPPSYQPEGGEQWPVVFFLHGAGERGADLSELGKHGLVRQVKEKRDFPFILVAPQCPLDWTWDRSLEELDLLLEEIITNFRVDMEQVYLTGLSMGGYGTWHWAMRQPNAFAALVPICGGTMPLMGFPQKIAALKHVPIWVFHGADDQVVPAARSQELVDVLTALDAPIRFTKYAGVGHHSWDRAYNESELIPWLLKQKNRQFALA